MPARGPCRLSNYSHKYEMQNKIYILVSKPISQHIPYVTHRGLSAVLCCGCGNGCQWIFMTYLSISSRVTSLVLRHSYNSHCAHAISLNGMDKTDQYPARIKQKSTNIVHISWDVLYLLSVAYQQISSIPSYNENLLNTMVKYGMSL